MMFLCFLIYCFSIIHLLFFLSLLSLLFLQVNYLFAILSFQKSFHYSYFTIKLFLIIFPSLLFPYLYICILFLSSFCIHDLFASCNPFGQFTPTFRCSSVPSSAYGQKLCTSLTSNICISLSVFTNYFKFQTSALLSQSTWPVT